MGDRAVDIVALIHRVLAWTFAVVGTIFLLAPNGTVRTINAVGSVFRVFPPAPESDLRFWLSLSVAYMALVTLLAARIAADPRANRPLMPILAAGKFTSSFTCLLFFVFSQPTFLYLLNFLVDGSIVLIVLGCYAWLSVVETTATAGDRPSGQTAQLLTLVVDTMVPGAPAVVPSADHLPLPEALWRYAGSLHRLGPVGLTVMLYVLEYGPYVFGPRRRRFSRMNPAERELYLASWESSRLAPRRQFLHALKLIVMLHAYESREARATIGDDGSHLRDKLLAGPNAAAHRARMA